MCVESKMAMKFLQTVQEDMRVMGFAPNQQQNSCWGFSSRQIISAFVYGLNCVLIGSNMFWGDNATSEENMDTIFTLIVFVPILAVFISIVLKNDQIFNTIDFLTLELNTRSKKSSVSRVIYEAANQRIEKLTKTIRIAVLSFCIPCFTLPKVIACYFIYYTTDAGTAAFNLQFPIWLPFDWRNPIGYLIAAGWEILVNFVTWYFVVCIVPFVTGGLLIVFSGAKDWTAYLRILHEMTQTKKSDTLIIKYTEHITELVRFHSNMIQMSHNYTNIFKFGTCLIFICFTVAICAAMIMFRAAVRSKDTIDPIELWAPIFLGFVVLGFVCFPCEIGQLHTDSFEQMSCDLKQLDWYLFPIEIQRMLPTILIGLQKPVVLDCYGVVACSREQFKRVINVVYTTFNALRKIFN